MLTPPPTLLLWKMSQNNSAPPSFPPSKKSLYWHHIKWQWRGVTNGLRQLGAHCYREWGERTAAALEEERGEEREGEEGHCLFLIDTHYCCGGGGGNDVAERQIDAGAASTLIDGRTDGE